MNWYVKGADGKVFGPADDAKILAWVKEGRVDPFAGVSNNLKTWKLASLEPSFEMDWIVENDPGRFYGPTHRAVIDDLMASGSLSPACRVYRDHHDGAMEKEAAAARAEAENAMAEVKAEAERMMGELKAEAEKAIETKDAELVALKSELKAEAEKALKAKDAELVALKSRLEAESEKALKAKDAELVALKSELERVRTEAARAESDVTEFEKKFASLTATKKREWKAEAVDPEIVPEEPPPTVREVFKPGRPQTLADLERQAQAELARMGASGAKKFFGLKR